MENRLIFDVGMHRGEDTTYYLGKGYRVVAIDAGPDLINNAKTSLAKYIAHNQLILVHCAISDSEGEVEFNISKKTQWSSLKFLISDRKSLHHKRIKVQSKRLTSLVREFGLPYYCKIDIAGYDAICLKTLTDLKELPQFISVESECVGEFETLSDEQALETLNQLYNLGYRKFKLVDQHNLTVLQPKIKFYHEPSMFIKFKRKAASIFRPREGIFILKCGHKFPSGSTGPFGDELEGNWLDYAIAQDTLLYHRKTYFELKSSYNHGFWCDWHAKLL